MNLPLLLLAQTTINLRPVAQNGIGLGAAIAVVCH
jgi:hypothetical protein